MPESVTCITDSEDYNVIRPTNRPPTLADSPGYPSSRSPSLFVSYTAKLDPDRQCVDYTLEPILCRSKDLDTEQYFGEEVSRQAVLNQFNSNTFASISHLLSLKVGPKL